MESTSQQPCVLAVAFGWGKDGTTGIAVMISPASFVETTDDPVPGVVLTPAQAREAAYLLLLHAEKVAAGLVSLPPRPAATGGG